MPVLFVFLLKVNIALLLFCAGYYLVLRRLTFYTLNRVYLLAAIMFASIYPRINLSAFVQRHEELAKPVLNWQIPAQIPLNEPAYWHWAEVIFWLGAYVLAIKLAIQLFSLYRLYKNSKPGTINNHQVRIMDKDAAPFSFWQSIFVNPSRHDPADLKAILLHEQVHVNQWHTADILLAELSSIFYWFNPGIWLMKKAIRENIEFITDQKILNKGIDSKSYQYSLVSVSFNNQQPGIVNHFNISTIKKRIIMMNAKRSSKLNLTRYAFLIPGVIALLLIFSISKADFAKPIRTKLVNAVKPLTKMVNPADVPNPINKATADKPENLVHKSTTIISDLKTDTNKKNKIIVKNSNGKDTAVYYLNGVKNELRIIDDNIAEVQPLKGEKISGSLKRSDSTSNINTVVLTGHLTNKQPNVKVYTKSFANHSINVNVTQPNITHSTMTFSYPTTAVVDTALVIKDKVTGVTVSNQVIRATNAGVTGSFTNHRIKGINFTTGKGSNPLIMINGREASTADVKKLDPNIIDNLTVLSGKGATKTYGDKAKDGVILITTKK